MESSSNIVPWKQKKYFHDMRHTMGPVNEERNQRYIKPCPHLSKPFHVLPRRMKTLTYRFDFVKHNMRTFADAPSVSDSFSIFRRPKAGRTFRRTSPVSLGQHWKQLQPPNGGLGLPANSTRNSAPRHLQ
jgi:hypothetical protein